MRCATIGRTPNDIYWCQRSMVSLMQFVAIDRTPNRNMIFINVKEQLYHWCNALLSTYYIKPYCILVQKINGIIQRQVDVILNDLE